ncbi:MAG TPA: DUF424 family protein [Candidatus Woesearchaeota archaeon]|jgi:hypothetical protein|nr:DUF424 family protein [Candidatus Woesearchaeota archaeon]
MKYFVSLKEDNGKVFLYVCDKEIKGKKISQGKKQIDLASNYYDWKELDDRLIIQLIKRSDSITFFGINSIRFGQDLNLLDMSNATSINDVPYCSVILK